MNKMKHLKQILVTAIVTTAILGFTFPMMPDLANARGFSSRSSFSSSRSSFSSSRSASKPAWANRSGGLFGGNKARRVKAPTKPQTRKKFASNSKASSVAKNSGAKKHGLKLGKKPPRKIPGSSMDKKLSKKAAKKRSAESLKNYKSQQDRFKGKAQKTDYSSPKARKDLKDTYKNVGYSDPKTYTDRRDNFYSNNGYNMPNYGYNMSPSFGIYDTMSLMYAMDHMDNPMYSMMFFANRHNPGMLLFMSAMHNNKSGDSAQDAKIKALEAKVAKMEKDGVKAEAGYVPEEMGDLILTKEAVDTMDAQNVAKLRFGTASKTGNYFRFGQILKVNAPSNLKVMVAETRGSYQNLELLASGKIDAALVQSDAFKLYGEQHPKADLSSVQGTMYQEYAHLIVNRKSGIEELDDLKAGKNTVLVPSGSGMEVTWKNIVKSDSKYAGIRTENLSGNTALLRVTSNPNAVMFVTISLGSRILANAKKHKKDLMIVAVDDSDLLKIKDQWGNTVYTKAELSAKNYKGLIEDGWLSDTINTVALNAVLVLSKKWTEDHGQEGVEAFSTSVLKAKSIMSSFLK